MGRSRRTGPASCCTELLSISAFARRVGLATSALRSYDGCRVLPGRLGVESTTRAALDLASGQLCIEPGSGLLCSGVPCPCPASGPQGNSRFPRTV
ncbi:hypothetical protein FNV59_07590 [Streptomyces sp. RLB1-8]|nr:hypothetical protein FNV67_07510 [Streptomyces sp. S1D4-20]QDO58041.1 hypothetical protein FNV59_07590 [Streptomyces sp. RLB1-8]